jgi:hypothetical protein
MRGKPNINNILLLIFVIVIFFATVYIYSTHSVVYTNPSQPPEYFKEGDLIPKDKIIVVQGNSLPELGDVQPIDFDEHESLPTVDGTKDGAKSMFMMSFNKCDPSCCPSTYSCSGGCVCMTKEQQNFIGSRGFNNKAGCSLKDNPEF